MSKGRLVDLSGKTFTYLKVIKRVENDKHGRAVWLCECTCGNKTNVKSSFLVNGLTKSCGKCGKFAKHGLSRTAEYKIFQSMKQRCYNPNNKHFNHYGGRDISIYQEWLDDFTKFYQYLVDTIGLRPEGKSLDRINNDGNYEPGNLRWATWEEQNNNQSDTIMLELDGETKSLSDWCRIYNANPRVVKDRLGYCTGWTVYDALTVPVVSKGGKKPIRNNKTRRVVINSIEYNSLYDAVIDTYMSQYILIKMIEDTDNDTCYYIT